VTIKPELAAAIDLGTNTALLLVARYAAGKGLIVVTDECRTPRLGAGLAARGTLDPAARERAIEALGAFAFRLKVLGVAPERTRVVGTAALRRAKDAAEFVAQVRARTGLSIEILPAEEEARLGLMAISADGGGPDTVIVDVGGGSTEIACGELDLRQSVPVGAVVLTEMFPSALDFPRLLEHARAELRAFPDGLARDRPVLALGGTAVNLACLTLDLARFDAQKAEGVRIDAAQALRFAEDLARMSVVARVERPIETERAMILPAGLACLGATLERLSASKVTVTTRGLRHGVLRWILGLAS
jgi:exopolyphosphatase/guanosine-5'-triphosphate,3'-diphosphate pyrophosphatase